jgi:hypothetical protein
MIKKLESSNNSLTRRQREHTKDKQKRNIYIYIYIYIYKSTYLLHFIKLKGI